MKIVIGADFVPTLSNEQLFIDGNIEQLFGSKLLNKLSEYDYRIFNLEIPLTNESSPIKKCGPNLIAKEETVNAMRKINTNLFTLANNHIFDQGVIGLKNTIKVLNKENISYVGVGKDLTDAKKPFIINDKGKNIGIYVCAEHEFSIVNDNHPGANPFDIFETYKDIRDLKSKCDYIIVLYHGGKEFYRYPSPQLQKRCEEMINSGANLVVTQHSHCIGCKEDYNSGQIIYGQGNFLFDLQDSEYWKTSILISIDTDKNEIDYIPLVKNCNCVRLANDSESKIILENFNKRSTEIIDKKFVENNYRKFASESLGNYIAASKGKTFIGKVINKLTKGWYYKSKAKRFNKNKTIILYNYLDCEAHYELFLEGLKGRIK